MRALHRVGNVSYTSYLPERVTTADESFDDYTSLDIVSHVTTIENAMSVIRQGFSPSLIDDYSVVSRVMLEDGSFHPLRYKPAIWLSPSAGVPVQESRYGNVAFSTEFKSLFHSNATKFYYIEFVNYVRERVVRILLTRNKYPLLEFDPMDSSSPLFFDRMEENWKFSASYNSREITMEIITDIDIPLRNVSYVKAPRRRAKAQESTVVGYFPVFIDDKLGYFFYSMLKEQIRTNSQYIDVTNSDIFYDQLASFLENFAGYGHSGVKILEEVDEKQNPDDIIKLLSFPRAFRVPTGGFDKEDFYNIRIAYTLFHKYRKSPSGTACILKFFELINNFVQELYRDDLQSINHLLSVFLGYFVKEEAEIIKEELTTYLAKVHERSQSLR